jgi:hypothetical protein
MQVRIDIRIKQQFIVDANTVNLVADLWLVLHRHSCVSEHSRISIASRMRVKSNHFIAVQVRSSGMSCSPNQLPLTEDYLLLQNGFQV